MIFWLITGTLSITIGLLLGFTLLQKNEKNESSAEYNLRVYRDQLKEIDRDLTRGVIEQENAERLRTEISRRILAADSQLINDRINRQESYSGRLFIAIISGIFLTLGSIFLYRELGAPGYGDLGLSERLARLEENSKNRPSQSEAENTISKTKNEDVSEDFLLLMQRLREKTTEQPDSLQGQILLAKYEAVLGDFIAGYTAQEQVLQLQGNESTAEDWANYAELLILAAGGYVSPKAENALIKALQLNPISGTARYYLGQMKNQIGRPDQAFAIWSKLLEEGQQDAAWIEPIRIQIQDVAARAGKHNFVLSPINQITGPTQNEIDEISELPPSEQAEMIASMVESLNQRLSDEGGTVDEWTRLIRSLVVLNRLNDAKAAYDSALVEFADNTLALQILNESARQADLIP
ncbi:MAG: c-type cytochrome biogenesis protein CcmI [Aestuariivita sp.]|nr:c-type cytochrome biogenesis protein CcmI [Aestuariivita sp.]